MIETDAVSLDKCTKEAGKDKTSEIEGDGIDTAQSTVLHLGK